MLNAPSFHSACLTRGDVNYNLTWDAGRSKHFLKSAKNDFTGPGKYHPRVCREKNGTHYTKHLGMSSMCADDDVGEGTDSRVIPACPH